MYAIVSLAQGVSGLQDPSIRARGPLGIGEALDRSLGLYRRAFLPIVGLSALVIGPVTLASLFLTTAWAGERLIGSLLGGSGQAEPTLSPESVVGVTILMLFGGALLGPLVYGAIIRVADRLWRGERPTGGEALLWSLRRLFAMLITGLLSLLFGMVLQMVTFLVGSFVLGFASLAFVGGFDGAPSSGASIALGVVSVLVMLVVIHLAWLAFLFVPQVIIVESRGYFVAIGKSLALVWSHLPRTMGHLWTALLLIGSLSLAVYLPQLLWLMVVGETGSDLVVKLAQGAVLLLTFPLMPLATTVAYFDLRLRREGGDLEARLLRLEEGVEHA